MIFHLYILKNEKILPVQELNISWLTSEKVSPPLSTYHLERSERLKGSPSTYKLERSQRRKKSFSPYNLELSKKLKGSY